MDATRLVATLTFRDLRRNVGAWRFPLLSSVLFAVLFVSGAVVTAGAQARTDDVQYSVAVDGDIAGASDLLVYLSESHLLPEPEADARQAVIDEQAAIGLTAPPGLDDRLADLDDPVELELLQRAGNNTSLTGTGWWIVAMHERYGVGDALVLDEADIGDDQDVSRQEFARSIAALSAFLALGAVTSVATILGGTRERRGADALLVLPVSRVSVCAGTAIGALPMAVLYVFTGIIVLLSTAALPIPTLSQPAWVIIDGTPAAAVTAVALASLGAALGVLGGSMGGGSADAMSVGDLLAMPVAALGILLLVSPDLPGSMLLSCVPALGSLLAFRDALLGEPDPLRLAVSTASTLAAAAALVWLAGKMLNSERNIKRA
jgi:hypothetical protein